MYVYLVRHHNIYGAYGYNISKGRSRCFAFDCQFEFARFSECQNQSVQKTPFNMYVSFPAPNPRKGTFSAGMTVQIYRFILIQQNCCESFFNVFACVRTRDKNENEDENENRKEDGDRNENEFLKSTELHKLFVTSVSLTFVELNLRV